MAKKLAQRLEQEMHRLITQLIELSLVDDQNFATRKDLGDGVTVIEAGYWHDAPRMTRHVPYGDLYAETATARAYDLRFLDGALAQLRYKLVDDEVTQARLAYLPAPDLTPYQTDPELYLHDQPYGDVVDQRSVTVPLRFDFDARPHVVVDLEHPHSHLTLGQYAQCRVPVAGALTPYYFLEFVLRSFYRTKDVNHATALTMTELKLPRTITVNETAVVHIGVPCTTG